MSDAELRALHARFLRAGSIPHVYLARDGTVLSITDSGAERLGASWDKVVGHSLFEFLPDMSATVRARLEEVFENKATLEVEDLVALPIGVRRLRSVLNPVCDESGVVVAAQSIGWDVTTEHETREALRGANDKLSVILEHSPALVLMIRRGGVITHINRVGPGFKLEDIVGGDSHLFVASEFHSRYDAVLALAFDEGQPSGFEFQDVQGSWWNTTIVPVKTGGRIEQVLSFAVDDTERRRLADEQLRMAARLQHAQKLESLGILAGGVAHDFNNILVAITVNTELALAEVPTDGAVAGLLRESLIGAERAAGLARQLLAYAGRGQFVIERIDLSRVVAETAHLVESSLPTGVRLQREMADPLSPIEGDLTQIRQVVLNFLTNAADAIGQQPGVIMLRTRQEHLSRERLAPALGHELAPGDYAVVEVQDTGKGMSEEVKARMFDPFFTTKSTGRGLGLAATLGIISQHRGAVVVDSTPGGGTRISAIFPVVAGTVASVAPLPTKPSARGEGLVLVVDDDDAVRSLAMRVLVRAGYAVLGATDGDEAIMLFDQHSEDIRLVLLDLTMPRVSGEQVLQRLRARAPALPVIIMSGFTESTIREHSVSFLAKPFHPEGLTTLVEGLLRQAASRSDSP